MRYFVSDLHGEYGLFCRLLDRLHLTPSDTLYIGGDIIDKGEASVRLLKAVSQMENVRAVLGNHELAFLQYYHSLLQDSPEDFDSVLAQLRAYFPQDGALLDWELIDWLQELPSYIEEDDFILVHAGVPVDREGNLLPLADASMEQLVFDRRFKEPHTAHTSPKCVLFGHTQTDAVCGRPKILAYVRNRAERPKTLGDFYKIHLDTGTWSNGTLGCFCAETLRVIYINKAKDT